MLKGKGILLPAQKAFLDVFAGLPDQEQFYLAGGAALTEFYLGHRLSFDLDFFTDEADLIRPFSRQIETECRKSGVDVTVVRRFETFAQLLFEYKGQSLKIDLAFDSPFHLQAALLSEYGVRVNDFEDLKADKVLAFFGRDEPRDAVDLYFFLQNDSLDKLLALAAQKDPGFDLYWFAVALKRVGSYPDEAEKWPVKMLQQFSPVALKNQFAELAAEIMFRLTEE